MLSEDHAQWLTARGIDLEIATGFGLDTTTRRLDGRAVEAISIPYERKGKILNHKYRLLGHEPKWTQDAGATQSLWNEDVLRDKTLNSEPVVIMEGEWDGMIAVQCGYVRTVSPPNGAGLNFELIDEIKPAIMETKRIILGGDDDEQGHKLNKELARRLGAARCYRLRYPKGCKDLNEIWTNCGPDAAKAALRDAIPYPIAGLHTLSSYPPQKEIELFPTGFPSLNAHFKLFTGEFCVVTGIPSHGKSRVMIELLCSMNLEHQHKSVLASPEMRIVPYVRDVMREHFHGCRIQNMQDDQKASADAWIEENFSFIDPDDMEDEDDKDLHWYIDRASDAVFRHGVRWVLLDPWNQIEHKREKFESISDYQARAFRAIKKFRNLYECGVIIVAHPTKEVRQVSGKIRKPTPYDMDGSAHWFNAPDHCLTIWASNVLNNVREVEVTKSRYRAAGYPGTAYLKLVEGRLQSTVDKEDEK